MWTALAIVLWALAAVFLLLLLALAIPLRFEFRASAGPSFRYGIALRLFNRSGPRLTLADSEAASRAKRRDKREKRARREKTGRKSDVTLRDPKRLLKAARLFVAEVFGQLRFENATLHVRFGAGDPAETGQIYGALTPLVYGSAGSRWLDLSVEPVFDAMVFEGRAALDVTFTPIRLFPPLIRFGWAVFGTRR